MQTIITITNLLKIIIQKWKQIISKCRPYKCLIPPLKSDFDHSNDDYSASGSADLVLP